MTDRITSISPSLRKANMVILKVGPNSEWVDFYADLLAKTRLNILKDIKFRILNCLKNGPVHYGIVENIRSLDKEYII